MGYNLTVFLCLNLAHQDESRVVLEDVHPMDWQALILWQDEVLVVLNKPARLLTLPDGYHPDLPHLRSVLEPHLGRLWIVHRLDRETSGIILLARSAAAHRALNDQFEQHRVEKRYHAIVRGAPQWEQHTVELPLRANVGRRKRTAVDNQQGKPAKTSLRLLEHLGAYSLVEASPQTGRTHQIRAHLAAIGFPIAGDPLYGPHQEPPDDLFQRTALHAWQLSIHHPLSGEACTWQAPYPYDFSSVLHTLRQSSLPGSSTPK